MHERVSTQTQAPAVVSTIDVAVMRCEGEMGAMELAHLGEELFRLANRGYRKVVVDLSRVDHVNYKSLRALAARARLLRSAGGDLKLSGLSPYVAAIFRAAGVDQDFEMHASAEEAKLAFVEAPVLTLSRR